MAKISRRAVASSSPASSSSSSSSSLSSSSAAAASASGASHGSPNKIQQVGKPQRPSFQAGGEGVSAPAASTAAPASAPVYPDPMRGLGAGHQLTTGSAPRHGQDFAATATTLGSLPTPGFSTARPTPDATAAPPLLQNKTLLLAAERERIRAEFFATYDVMTGVRIAATLGGFFGLMVFLIVWKSRSSSNETLKVLKDPKMAAVAAVCMQEEEDRKIQEAMVATGMSIYPDEYDAILYRRQRLLSLGNVSAPPVLHRGFRFSSVGGGYSSLLEPPRRFSYSYGGSSLQMGGAGGGGRRKSGSESSRVLSNYAMGSSFGMDDFFVETDDELEGGDFADGDSRRLEDELGAAEAPRPHRHQRRDSAKGAQGLLAVPTHTGFDSRRSSAMTCCSTDSSYLERRCSAFTLGLGNLPPSLQRKLSSASRTSSTDLWDYYYPDIQVIQPTPKASPCPSERSLYDQMPPTAASTNATATRTATPSSRSQTAPPTSSAANGARAGTGSRSRSGSGSGSGSPPMFVRKHSIALYDPESAQAGRRQQIHSISADTADLFPYKVPPTTTSGAWTRGGGAAAMATSGPGSGPLHHESPTEELRLNVLRKIAVVELPRPAYPEHVPSPAAFESNNNSFPYSHSAAAIALAAGHSSLSIDSTPASAGERQNGSGSLGTGNGSGSGTGTGTGGTGTGRTFFSAEKRAPLASLSSFKISSLEYQDSEMRSLDEDSVFLDSVADTDEDMQQFSSDSEEVSLSQLGPDAVAATAAATTTAAAAANVEPTVTVRTHEAQRHGVEKRFSLGGATPTAAAAATRPRRPLLQRHRTISAASSSDRISLIGQQLKEFPSGGCGGNESLTPQPLETHFGSVISTSSPPTHPRRAQLLQQYSDPQTQSLPTNTTTTTTTEDDTCPTLNTEVCAGAGAAPATRRSSAHSDGTGSSVGSAGAASANLGPTPSRYQRTRSRLADDPCVSSVSDSVICGAARQPVICVPSSLKSLILRGSGSGSGGAHSAEKVASPTSPYACNRSSSNLSRVEPTADGGSSSSFGGFGADGEGVDDGDGVACPSVMLELPLIRLPTDDSSEGSSGSMEDVEHSRSVSDESRDPSLPGSSRKWSKETLF